MLDGMEHGPAARGQLCQHVLFSRRRFTLNELSDHMFVHRLRYRAAFLLRRDGAIDIDQLPTCCWKQRSR